MRKGQKHRGEGERVSLSAVKALGQVRKSQRWRGQLCDTLRKDAKIETRGESTRPGAGDSHRKAARLSGDGRPAALGRTEQRRPDRCHTSR